MNLFAAMLTALALFTPALLEAQTMVISRAGSRAARTPPPDNFTGNVSVEMLFDAVDPSHASGGYVTFEPRARTAWHSHPRGQILIVTAGVGRVQLWGHPIEEIRAGDVVRIRWSGSRRSQTTNTMRLAARSNTPRDRPARGSRVSHRAWRR
jgi:quercetin dioxygenase-like cupin family protein